MPDLKDGESTFIKGSGAKPYELKNVGGVYSCSCPAWRNQSLPIERRTCKHLKAYRGEAAESARLGGALTAPPRIPAKDKVKPEGPPLLLAERWEADFDLTGWWMSEKLDGFRAYWDGKGFLSRLGNKIHAPDWFVVNLPDVPLDGELWLGRKQFQRTSSIVRRQDKSDHWKQVKFVVFDAPALDKEFEARLEFITAHVKRYAPAYAQVLEQSRCKGLDHVRSELRRVEELGGEGLMMRQPASKYVVGRSMSLLKVKTFLDSEAKVLRHLPGEGRHKGRLGALEVELANGTRFSVGTGFSDKERENPPPLGSVISFRYQELSDGGVPRFPSYVGVRTDAPASAPPPAKAAAAAPPKVAATVPAAPPKGGKRHFECVEGNSSKFWEVWVSDKEVTTRWGRIGSDGQTKTKTFADAARAAAEMARLIAEKTGKGYVEK
jgi:DNA ligase 1